MPRPVALRVAARDAPGALMDHDVAGTQEQQNNEQELH